MIPLSGDLPKSKGIKSESVDSIDVTKGTSTLKRGFAHSDFGATLKKLGITHLIMTGITTDVCVHTIMREANDIGYWCILLKDCTGATNQENYEAAIKQIKMKGGVFGWVTDSNKFINSIKDAR